MKSATVSVEDQRSTLIEFIVSTASLHPEAIAIENEK